MSISCIYVVITVLTMEARLFFAQAKIETVGNAALMLTLLASPVHWQYVSPLPLLSQQKAGSTLPTAAVKFRVFNIPPSPLSTFELHI